MLTQLHIDFGEQVPDPVLEQDLLPLANLHSLKDLTLQSYDRNFLQPLLSVELAGSLASLTSLYLSGCPVSRLRHVSSLTALQVLTAACPNGLEEELGQAEWAAVGQLTGLVELELFNAKVLFPSDNCRAALRKLPRLRKFAAWTLSTDVLSALTACTQLTALEGGWRQGGSSSVRSITRHGVQSLYGAVGSPPFAALPNLLTVEQFGPLSTAAFASMAQHCTGLQQLMVADELEQFTSLPANAPQAARIAAVQALSVLTCLTRLDFLVQDSVELAALVGVAGTLLSTGVLYRLGVYLMHNAALQHSALMPLAKLHGLRELLLQPHPSLVVEVADHAADVLGALSGIRNVAIVGVETDVVEKCMAAWGALHAAGLPCPEHLTVQKG